MSNQEIPGSAPASQLPRSPDVVMDEDLVDRCKSGDHIPLVDIYRSMGCSTFKWVSRLMFWPVLT
jgi:DNA replication licensing factor MCM3